MENLSIALQITIVGMGLVFGAILVLWGVMVILVRLGAEPAERNGEAAHDKSESGRRKRAAAVAVAIALARQAESTELHEFPLPATPLVTAWQAVMRTNMHNKRGRTR
jgi:Na+-transporting methylmalonyl-CoA/oxaloacetate decarboxylase gamma subunit